MQARAWLIVTFASVLSGVWACADEHEASPDDESSNASTSGNADDDSEPGASDDGEPEDMDEAKPSKPAAGDSTGGNGAAAALDAGATLDAPDAGDGGAMAASSDGGRRDGSVGPVRDGGTRDAGARDGGTRLSRDGGAPGGRDAGARDAGPAPMHDSGTHDGGTHDGGTHDGGRRGPPGPGRG